MSLWATDSQALNLVNEMGPGFQPSPALLVVCFCVAHKSLNKMVFPSAKEKFRNQNS